tara:strand:+ start:9118 stop:10362 length:1245 start_codon:yes stop_codon:yes gene_type:complete
MAPVSRKSIVTTTLLIAVILFLGWRFLRPINIFVVSEAFERPIPTDQIPALFKTLSAQECAVCHREFFDEWKTTIHNRAWTDPYFQADWLFDRSQQVCKNCHIPLDAQQEQLVMGFRDREKWEPILAPNPDFDPGLQHEGVTCAACHFREGKILGPFGSESAPHPVKKMDNPNRVCVRCHVVTGERWDAFFRFPPCGTVAEIKSTRAEHGDGSGEEVADDLAGINCVDCHMPLVERPLVPGGEVRQSRRHWWRGGHDPEMVRSGLKIGLEEETTSSSGKRRFTLTLTNVGAAHYLPTGTPDRHLTVALRLRDKKGNILNEVRHTLKRTLMWRPFIIDLWDTRLAYREPRSYSLEFSVDSDPKPEVLEAVVRYHLLDEKRRQRIGYDNKEPIAYDVYRKRLSIMGSAHEKEKIVR